MVQTHEKGTFIGHMYQCYADGKAGATVFDRLPFHPLFNLAGIIVAFLVLFVVLVGAGDESEEEEDEKEKKN